jgi:hypothetical protein
LAAAKAEFQAMLDEGVIRQQPMEQPAKHGPEEGWLVSAMRRLPPTEPSDGGG